jgi:hypothetical protein
MQLTILLILSTLWAQNAQTPSSTATIAATIEGTVVVRRTPTDLTPLSGVNVELRAVQTNTPKNYFAESSDAGQFRFRNVAPGRYRLFATREGYVPGEYGQKQLNTPGILLDVSSDTHLTQMNLTLTMTGAISGRIFWPTGRPQGISLVEALRPSYEDGKRTLTVVQSTRTDDLGNYRLFWLPPGQYFLSAMPPNGPIDPTLTLNADATNASLSTTRENRRTVLTRPVAATTDDEIFAPIYYPGSADDKNAVAIEVVPGGEARGIDITAGFIRSYRVRGVIVDNEIGEIVKNAQVRATQGNQSGIVPLDANTGAFSLGHLPPGTEMVLTAVAGNKSGRYVISIRDHDFEIRVPIHTSFTVSGRLLVDGRQARAEEVAGLRFTVQANPTGIGGLQPTGSFGVDGRFSFAIAPGDYFLNIAPILNRTGIIASNIPIGNIPGRVLPVSTAFNIPATLKDVYVKSIRLGDKDALNGGLHLDGATSEVLEIELSTQAATLAGIVEDGTGVPAANVVTVLIPDEPLRQRPDLYKVTRTDGAGRFMFDRIPAGAYNVFAWEQILDGAWRDSDVMRQYDSRGTAIRIEDGRHFDTKVMLTGAPER